VRASRTQKIAAAFVALAMGAVGFLPLFGGPGYEHALATGLVVPSAAAIAVALDGVREPARAPLGVASRGLVAGVGLALVSLVTAIVHGLRVGMCDFWGGVATFAMTAGVGCAAGGVWGAIAGESAARRKRPRLWAVLLGLAAPLATIGLGVWRFYSTPIVFAFDPFVGYFSGTLYDTVIDAGTPLYTYRAGTAAAIAAVLFAASVVRREGPRGDRLRLVVFRGAPAALARAVAAVAFGAAALAVTASGHALGHWQSSDSIAAALGGARDGARCNVRFPLGMRDDEVLLLVKDCEDDLAAVESALGGRGPERVTAFFFRDPGEKKRLMGAADTYIAKPWRREVYLQVHAYPHPVLAHELAHVVAGSFAPGPFHVAGRWGGAWPNPGLIEGIAVAAAPDDDELTDAQWARAMMDRGMLPKMSAVFGIGFLGDSAAKSYTVAGAFVGWVLATYGKDAVRAWYGGATLEGLTGATWDELDATFRKALAKYTLSNEAGVVAEAKFGRPGLFGRTCPHVVDAIRREADGCRDNGQYDKAIATYARALERDPHDNWSRLGQAGAELRFRDAERGRAQMSQIAADESLPRTMRDRAEDTLADVDYLDGRYEEAAARYERIAARSLDEDFVRNLLVKALAARDPAARFAVQALLLGERRRTSDPFVGAEELGAWWARTGDPLADYLLGKNLAQHGFYGRAAVHLDRALAAGVPLASVGREALRQRAVCACAMGDVAAAARVRRDVLDAEGPFKGTAGGRQAQTLAQLDRCAAP
jgi:tetratricopeptide (TPR) repeat protein